MDFYRAMFLVFLMNIPMPTTAASKRCRMCEYKGQLHEALSRFEVQLSSCRTRECFCRCDGRVTCPWNLYRVTCKDDCMPCLNPFSFNRLPPFATFRSGIFVCECGCFGTYSCSTA
uniref:TNFR-Cys domain-containing protein n=1 Tax=Magallana gigas TaxID=29159 RepID=A0A8W8NWD3_MAGGI